MKDVQVLYKKSREERERIVEYLARRGLSDFGDVGYVELFLFRERVIKDSLLFFVRSLAGEITKVIARGMLDGEKWVVYNNYEYISLYNIKGLLTGNLPVVVCEGVLDCESLRQYCEFLVPLSFCTASIGRREEAFLNLLLFGERDLFVCFDKDFSGAAQAKKVCERGLEYGNRFRVLDVPYKDVNEFLVRRGRDKFTDYFRERVLV